MKPCPFCGNRNVTAERALGTFWRWYVSCSQCGATGPSGTVREAAEQAWDVQTPESRHQLQDAVLYVTKSMCKWELLGRCGFTVSVAFGPCGTTEPAYSVNVLTPEGKMLDMPYRAKSFDHAIQIAEKEIDERRWDK